MQLRGIIPKLEPRKTCAGVIAAAFFFVCCTEQHSLTSSGSGFSLSHSHRTGTGEEHSGRGWRGSLQRKGQKDPQAEDYLLECTAPSAQQEVSTDAVFGSAGAGGAGSLPRSHPDAGESLHRHPYPPYPPYDWATNNNNNTAILWCCCFLLELFTTTLLRYYMDAFVMTSKV